MMREKKEMNEMTKLTFENVPEYTYWKNPKTGTILSLLVQRNQEEDYLNDSPKRLSMWTCNTRYELLYSYSWDEIVKKFDYLGECDSDDYYTNVLSNKEIYWRYRSALKGLPGCLRAIKRGSDSNILRESVERYTTWKDNFESKFN